MGPPGWPQRAPPRPIPDVRIRVSSARRVRFAAGLRPAPPHQLQHAAEGEDHDGVERGLGDGGRERDGACSENQ